jgi:hypothetical protein
MVSRAIKRAGSASTLALILGVTPSTVRRWRSGGEMKRALKWELRQYLENPNDEEVFKNVLGGVKVKVKKFDRPRGYERTPGWEIQEPIRLMGAKAITKVLKRVSKIRRKQRGWANIDLLCSQWGEGPTVGSKNTYIKGSPQELTAETHMNSGLQRNLKDAIGALKEKLAQAAEEGVIIYVHALYIASYDRVGMPPVATTGQ